MFGTIKKAKEKARKAAKEFQAEYIELKYTCDLLAKQQKEIETIAKRYGLTIGFPENEII